MTEKEKFEKLKKLADAMYYAAQNLTTDASRLHKAMDEYRQFIINEYYKEEPVSEDLEEAAEMFIDSLIPTEVDTVTPFAAEYVIGLLNKAIKFGVNWQKTKDQSTIELAEDHAMLAGMEKMKEQMMVNAVDAVVKVDAGGYPYVDRTIELYDYDKDIPLAKEGDKYKVILIKE